jgi:hypothetical protein
LARACCAGNSFHIIHQEKIRMSAVRTVVVGLLSLISSFSLAADGLFAIKSPHSVKDTIDRFEAAAKARGLNLFL